VLEGGEKETGVTIHVVDAIYGHGDIVAQKPVPIRTGDTPESLAARVSAAENGLIVEALRRIARGDIALPIIPR
jgi:phosphoribosylglycinamide formyltransferase-1